MASTRSKRGAVTGNENEFYQAAESKVARVSGDDVTGRQPLKDSNVLTETTTKKTMTRSRSATSKLNFARKTVKSSGYGKDGKRVQTAPEQSPAKRGRKMKCTSPTPTKKSETCPLLTQSSLEELAATIFGEVGPKCEQTLAKRLKYKRYEYKERAEAGSTLITEFRKVMTQYHNATKSFISDAVEAERTLVSEKNEARCDSKTALERASQMESQISSLRDESARMADELQESQILQREAVEQAQTLAESMSRLECDLDESKQAAKTSEVNLHEAVKLAEELSQAKEELTLEREQLIKAHKDEIDQTRTSLTEDFQAQIGQIRELLDDATEKGNDLTTELSTLQSEHSSTVHELEKSTSMLSTVNLKLEEVTAEAQERKSERDILKAQCDSLTSQLGQKSSELAIALTSIGDIQKANSDRENQLREVANQSQEKAARLEQENRSLQDSLTATQHELSTRTTELESVKAVLEKTEQAHKECLAKEEVTQRTIMELSETLAIEKELRARAESHEEEERRERTAACAQLLAQSQAQEGVLSRLTEEKNQAMQACELKVQGVQQELLEAQKATREAQDKFLSMEGEAKKLRSVLEDERSNTEELVQLARQSGEVDAMRYRMQEQESNHGRALTEAREKIQELEQEILKGESIRRKMHNTIQELRGNVRVFARVRPFLPGDGVGDTGVPHVLSKHDGTAIGILKPGEEEESHAFTFDKTFSPSTGQEQVFTEVSEFVQSALDGYQVCLFSYGQTGSGKTHTMQGSRDGPMRGIIPRAIEQVGVYKDILETQGWAYTMEVTFVEIYNETIRDLLRPIQKRSAAPAEVKNSLDIRTNPDGSIFISDVTRMSVNPDDRETIDNILELAARQRAVGVTDMNSQSSRSHSVFTLHLKGENASQRCRLKGALNLVDLAGSERLSRSGATGERLKETQSINKSLSCLSDVFTAISNKQAHIPFRNSKLTHLLSPALSGDGKTLMMVNLSPTEESYHESLCSLRFASTVNKCELGRAKKQIQELSGDARKAIPEKGEEVGAPG